MDDNRRTEITDFRSALELLKKIPGQVIETNEQVDPHAELSGVYRYVGAGGTVQRPTQIGPAMIFNNIKGYPCAKVAIGLLASRERAGYILGEKPERLGFLLNESVHNPIDPVTIPNEKAICQEVVHYATDEGFDVRKMLPAPTNTEEDAGPYITFGHCYVTDPNSGKTNITIHRLCVQDRDELSMWITPGIRHTGTIFANAEKLGQPLPVAISIGVDPAISIASCFEPPTTPFGYDELSAAGALRKKAVELVQCLTINEKAIANAEYVIEGELIPNVRVKEDQHTNTGKAMPEFPGYTGPAATQAMLFKIKAITHRKDPIMHSCIGPSEEHVLMAGLPTEASILQMTDRAMPGKVLNVYAHSAGGGKFMAVLQFKKTIPSDEGRQRQAALLAFAAFSGLKHVILVDDDVDPFDSSDVLWALNTRYQGDIDTIFIPGISGHPLEPSQSPDFNPMLRSKGMTCKTIFDCTVPFQLKDRFQRAQFKKLDPTRFAPELFKKD